MSDLLTALRNHLAGQGVIRKPSVAGTAPPLWLEPKLGTPAPGEGGNPTEVGSTAVLAAFLTGGIAPAPYESFLRTDIVDIWLRTLNASVAIGLDAQIRAELADRRDWDMSDLHVLDSEQWRPLQRLSSDEQGFTHIVSYAFTTGGHQTA